ncbi:MAG: rod shape-determining protein RodA [Opitutales bacterium]|nr:rod shape-determining protein RodA [Opitutales bacterium]
MKPKITDENLPSREKPHDDILIPLCMAILSIMGLAFIYTSQTYDMEETSLLRQFWFRQSVFLAIGAGVYYAISRANYEKFFVYAHAIYALSVLLLVPLALKECFGLPMPFVQSRFNATRWINIGIFSLQPSEIAKIGTLIMVAAILARSKIGTVKESLKVLLKLGIVTGVPILLIFLQPDLGSTLVFPPMVFAMLYVSNLSKRFFITALGIFAVLISVVAIDLTGYASFLKKSNMGAKDSAKLNAYGSSALCLPMKDYQRNRILAFVAPEFIDKKGLDTTWNLNQSLISIGSGGMFGKGVGEGTQAKLGFLPSAVAYNDFIFAVLAEETGFAGGMFALALLGAIVLFSCPRAATLSRDRFGRLLCAGVAATLATHIFINVGMTLGIMPITGLPLPMLSYGGSFVLTCCVLLGLVQSVYRHKRQFQ